MPTLREIFSNTADAIRTKTGKSDLISPPNFPTEIANIKGENTNNFIVLIKTEIYEGV